MTVLSRGWGRAMPDELSVTFTHRRSDAPHAIEPLPWQLAVLLICFTALAVVLAILYPDVFGEPIEQF
jgi:hypothetical protein